MVPSPADLERFARDLDGLIPKEARIGIAVSGGPDSVALLLLAAAARRGSVEAATVDHQLRTESAEEADSVSRLCAQLDIPHTILDARWAEKPASAIQERARQERYRLLGAWAEERRLDAVATGHHLDDQAETIVMRLKRGAGVRGLAGMRTVAKVPGSKVSLIRPLLGWRREHLGRICADAGVEATNDPSNEDSKFERARVRSALRDASWLDPQALAASAAHLGEADSALDWAVQQEWTRAVTNGGWEVVYRPSDAPSEICRRIVTAAITRLATEGDTETLRGRELDQLMTVIAAGGQATIRGVLCAGGLEWRFRRAPPRKI